MKPETIFNAIFFALIASSAYLFFAGLGLSIDHNELGWVVLSITVNPKFAYSVLPLLLAFAMQISNILYYWATKGL